MLITHEDEGVRLVQAPHDGCLVLVRLPPRGFSIEDLFASTPTRADPLNDSRPVETDVRDRSWER